MNEGTVLGQVAILATTILGFAFTWMLANRRRKWDLEDMTRKAEALAQQVTATANDVKNAQIQAALKLAQQVTATAADVQATQLDAALKLAQQVTATAAELKATQIQAADALAAKVEASAVDVRHDLSSAAHRIVQAADRAYSTANNLNAKIATVTAATNDQFNSLLNSATTDRKLAKIDGTTTDIETKVTNIQRDMDSKSEAERT